MRLSIVAMAALAACVPEGERLIEPMPYEKECGAEALQHLVGNPVASYDFDTLGGPVRILPPGSAMTMDHRPDRLNVELNDRDVITRLWCG